MTIGIRRNLSPEQKHRVATTREKIMEAVRVMRMLPLGQRDRPARLQAFWVAYGNSGVAETQYRRAARPKATPAQMRDMEYWLDRVLKLEPESRRIVMARAAGIPWRRLEEMDGRSHTTLRKVESAALLKIADMTNTPRVNTPRVNTPRANSPRVNTQKRIRPTERARD